MVEKAMKAIAKYINALTARPGSPLRSALAKYELRVNKSLG